MTLLETSVMWIAPATWPVIMSDKVMERRYRAAKGAFAFVGALRSMMQWVR
jgi:hypothetical protein